MTEYRCREFERAVDYEDFSYYRVGEVNYGSIRKTGWGVLPPKMSGKEMIIHHFRSTSKIGLLNKALQS